MRDFTSALYLGLDHPSDAVRWEALTLGRPAALEEPPGARVLAARLAALAGCAAATLASSTLHLFWDLFAMLGGPRTAVLVDAASYPIARWGAARAQLAGAVLDSFAHGDARALAGLAARHARAGRRPVVLADGYAPRTGRAPPLREYAAVARAHGGWLVLDDTQAFGVLGARPDREHPYGCAGGGTLRWQGVRPDRILLGCSLAKAFGVPLAFLAGDAAALAAFEERSEVRVHCSPPSVAHVACALAALTLNRRAGAALRRRLAQRVACWRACLASHGLQARGGWFPVQTVLLPAGLDPGAAYAALLGRGVRAVPQAPGGRAALSFLLTVRHGPHDIEQAVGALAAVLGAAHAERSGHGHAVRSLAV